MKSQLVTITTEVPDHVATGQKMRDLRKAAGLSLLEVGLKMGVSTPFLSDLELGRRKWTEERAQQFVAALKK